jgi:leucine-zipper of insertion element IS481
MPPQEPPQPSARAVTQLSEGQRQLAMARFAVLRPYLEDGVALAQAARTAGVALRTTERRLSRYRAAGLSVWLPRSGHSRQAAEGSGAVDRELWVNDTACEPRSFGLRSESARRWRVRLGHTLLGRDTIFVTARESIRCPVKGIFCFQLLALLLVV